MTPPGYGKGIRLAAETGEGDRPGVWQAGAVRFGLDRANVKV